MIKSLWTILCDLLKESCLSCSKFSISVNSLLKLFILLYNSLSFSYKDCILKFIKYYKIFDDLR